MKGIPAYSPLVKVAVRGVFQFGVLFHNLRQTPSKLHPRLLLVLLIMGI